jgi:hypothetical protein
MLAAIADVRTRGTGHWILGVITKAFVNNPGLAAAQFFYHFSFAVVNRQRRVGPFR